MASGPALPLPEEERRSFADRFSARSGSPLEARSVSTLQLNLTRRCNLSCRHCHAEGGPGRAEEMSPLILDSCLRAARGCPAIAAIDVTGGAPELHPGLEGFLLAAAGLGRRLIVRSNLAILLQEPYSRFLDIYAAARVEVTASLPDPRQERTDRQRGQGVFARTIDAIKELNARGYAGASSGLVLNLVHNPVGAFLPGAQAALEREYRTRLSGRGVAFNSLFCLANMPLGRYRGYLLETGNYDDYMSALRGSYNPAAAEKVMCRDLISVGWDGRLYDCDFNQALGLPLKGGPSHIDDFDPAALSAREINAQDHCYGCTAGQGSSCGGSLTEEAGIR